VRFRHDCVSCAGRSTSLTRRDGAPPKGAPRRWHEACFYSQLHHETHRRDALVMGLMCAPAQPYQRWIALLGFVRVACDRVGGTDRRRVGSLTYKFRHGRLSLENRTSRGRRCLTAIYALTLPVLKSYWSRSTTRARPSSQGWPAGGRRCLTAVCALTFSTLENSRSRSLTLTRPSSRGWPAGACKCLTAGCALTFRGLKSSPRLSMIDARQSSQGGHA
jgi:hypothetical protein